MIHGVQLGAYLGVYSEVNQCVQMAVYMGVTEMCSLKYTLGCIYKFVWNITVQQFGGILSSTILRVLATRLSNVLESVLGCVPGCILGAVLRISAKYIIVTLSIQQCMTGGSVLT